MTTSFAYEVHPTRVIFGAGRISAVPSQVERLGARRAVVIAAPEEQQLAAPLERALGERLAGRIDQVRQHVPEAVAGAARERVAELAADVLIALGGGSTTGVAKAVALTTGLPILAIPTTYAGSEMTAIWGITTDGRKRTGHDPRVLPRAVVYDPELTVDLPVALTVASGMNALAHCAEALWLPNANPVTSAVAEDGIRALVAGLPRVVAAPRDVGARAQVLYGAHLGGTALGTVGTGPHHKLAHILGGSFDLPHADVHTVLLPYTTALLARRRPDAAARIARGVGAQDAPARLQEFARSLGGPHDLASLGMTEAQVGLAAEAAADAAVAGLGELRELLTSAWLGERPPALDPRDDLLSVTPR